MIEIGTGLLVLAVVGTLLFIIPAVLAVTLKLVMLPITLAFCVIKCVAGLVVGILVGVVVLSLFGAALPVLIVLALPLLLLGMVVRIL